MPRSPRLDAPGAIHHVIVRGIEKQSIFSCDADRQEFLDRLSRQISESGGACFAWALIPNHAHLVLRTGLRPLSETMRRLNTGYAIWFNRRRERSGYLFQDRYRSILVDDDAYLRVLVRYVHLNPLRAGLVRTLRELSRYPWAGHAGLMGHRAWPFQAVDETLGWFGPDFRSGRAELQHWMELGLDAAQPLASPVCSAPPPPRVPARSTIDAEAQAVTRATRLAAQGWNLDALIDWACHEVGADSDRLRRGGRGRAECEARRVIGLFATRDLAYTSERTARATGVTAGALSRAIRRGVGTQHRYGLELPPTPPASE